MRHPLRKSLITLGTIAAFYMALFAISVAGNVQADSSLQPKSGERLLVIHDGASERGILTRQTTVRDALKEAKIPLDSNDMVEPGPDEALVASSYDINIYRARPVTIIDGPIRKKVMSPYRTPNQIVEHAGMQLQDEDTTTTSMSADDGVTMELTIKRATPFTLVLYGKNTTVYTQTKTVAAMLKEKHITLGQNDTLSVATSAPITANMTIELWRNGTQTVTQDEDIPFDTEKTQDADHDIGYSAITTPGVVGKRTVTYEIEMKNGQEISRKEIQSVTTKEPVRQEEVVGTKVNLPAGSHEDWMAAAGIAASDYGYVNYIVGHEGGWEPCKVQGGAIDCSYAANGGQMGYGIVQATPGKKMQTAGSDWATNPITQLRWATGYANGRYGSWAGAYNYWISHHNW